MSEKLTLRDNATMRWLALLLLALAMFCSYIFMDILSPIKDLMMSERGWDSTAFGTMQGAETFLNVFVFFLIFAGIILDKMGVRFTAVLSGLVMLVGAGIQYYAVSESFIGSGVEEWFTNHLNYIPGFDELGVSPFYEGMPASAKLAAIGFMIFGCGTEMGGITVSRGIVKWFKGRETAMAMGSEMALARLGVATCMIFSPFFAKLGGNIDVSRSVAFGVVLLCIALIMFVVYFFMDKKLDAQTGEAEEKDDPFKISDIGKILKSGGFWLVALLCVLYYSAIFPFQKYAVNMLQCNLTLEEPILQQGVLIFNEFGDVVSVNDPQTLVYTDSLVNENTEPDSVLDVNDSTLQVKGEESGAYGNTIESTPAVPFTIAYKDTVISIDMPNLNAENSTVVYEIYGERIVLTNGQDLSVVKLGNVKKGDVISFGNGIQTIKEEINNYNFWASDTVTFVQYAIMLLVAICAFVGNFMKKKGWKIALMVIAVIALVDYCYMGYMRGTAETIFAVFPLLAVAITPILGGYVDKKGKAASMLMIGSLLLIVCHLTFAFILPMFKGSAVGGTVVAYVTILVLGASFSLVPAALWPSVPKLVDEKIIGSAYALIFWIQNIGLWLFPLLIGKVLDSTNPGVTDPVAFDYTWPLVMLACLGVASFILGIILKGVDKKKGLGLEEPNIK